MRSFSVNPCVDIAFKKLFGVEENKDLLISLLNAIVSEKDQIADIELLNPYNERNFREDKLSILDVKAKNKHDGTFFLIEMQLSNESDYSRRGLYGWARAYSNQLRNGGRYQDLRRTIAVHILNFTFIDYDKIKGWETYDPNKYHHCFVLNDRKTRVEIFQDIEIHTIELSKFQAIDDENLTQVVAKIRGALDRWVALLTKCDLLKNVELPRELDTPEIHKALQVVNEMSMTHEERVLYDDHLEFLRRKHSIMDKVAMDAEEEGIRKGMEKGMAKGMEKGMAKGMEQGKQEEKIAIAHNMLQKGIPIKLITEITGLSEEEISKLEKELV